MKSAQQKFNEYLAECHETTDAVNEFIKASLENYGNYAYACGSLECIVKDLIGELPKAKRAEMRERFRSMAQKQKNEHLAKVIKETV